MKIWLDDIRQPPDETWTVAHNYFEFMQLLYSGKRIEEISFDHDLGLHMTGYDCLCKVELLVRHGMPVPKMRVHSANASVHKKMRLAIKAINDFDQSQG